MKISELDLSGYVENEFGGFTKTFYEGERNGRYGVAAVTLNKDRDEYIVEIMNFDEYVRIRTSLVERANVMISSLGIRGRL